MSSTRSYLDKDWFQKFKEIYSYKRSYFVNKNPELEISKNSIKVLNDISSLPEEYRKKLRKYSNRKQRKIDSLIEEIKLNEKNKFIRTKYLKKLQISNLDNQINYAKVSDLNNNDKPKIINDLLLEKWNIDEKEIEVFINEFIDFVKFLIKKYPEIKKLESLSKSDFYHVVYTPSKVDFEIHWKNYQANKELIKRFEEKKFSSEEVKKIIRKFMTKVNLKGIRIRVEDRLLFSVEPIVKRINIPSNLELSAKRLIEIIAHEVCVHLYRSINGYRNKNENDESIKVIGSSDTENLDIEEGIATYFEQNIFYQSGKNDIFRLYNHYFSAIAVHLARNFEPIEVYRKLVDIKEILSPVFNAELEKSDAASQKRLKRIYGDFGNPEKGLINPKISIYLLGNRKIWNFIEEGGNLINLFSGKVAIEDLKYLKKNNYQIATYYLGKEEIDFESILEIITNCFS